MSLKNEINASSNTTFSSLCKVLDTGSVTELGLVPLPPEHHPEPFTLEDGKLGIAMWCVVGLVNEARKLFESSLQRYNASSDDVILLRQSSMILLLINPDHYTCWNTRKRLCVDKKLEAIAELNFVALVLTKHPKSGCSWSHRRWLLKHNYSQSAIPKEQLGKELELCTWAAERYARCYFAWRYRHFVCGFLVDQCQSDSRNSDDVAETLEVELANTRKWVIRHVTDYSAIVHNQVLLCLIDRLRGCMCLENWQTEARFCFVIAANYPGHKAVWLQLRYVVTQLLKHVKANNHNVSLDNIVNFPTHSEDWVSHVLDRYIFDSSNQNVLADIWSPQNSKIDQADLLSLPGRVLGEICEFALASIGDRQCSGYHTQRQSAVTLLVWMYYQLGESSATKEIIVKLFPGKLENGNQLINHDSFYVDVLDQLKLCKT